MYSPKVGWVWLILLLCVSSSALSFVGPTDEANPKVVWKGVIHFGDNPEVYSTITSAGMCMEIPYKSEFSAKQKIRMTVSDVQTLSGDGHFVEVIAHYEKQWSTEDISAETFRIKDQSGTEKEFAFDFDPKAKLQKEPTYYSLRIRVDNAIPFSLWDDFLVKHISLD